ncbi:hypothetical protein C7S16_6547 [Burkholderia thailandensis]|uniref:Uncharacterized protein n=1 Tax=Burkholderia thailandensis TaxID=57975 RepID=A0AAW9CQK7_BURTH|nr:hypothetical protein [Burkholderia thailandensis]MDW9250894.1 hypothetical protein [Burkholderia thailandensis]
MTRAAAARSASAVELRERFGQRREFHARNGARARMRMRVRARVRPNACRRATLAGASGSRTGPRDAVQIVRPAALDSGTRTSTRTVRA